jgi:hypothetical protein
MARILIHPGELLSSPFDEKLIFQSESPLLISEMACSKGIASV